MKNTKLFLGVLIAALVLGFASCKQEAQDVNVVGNEVVTKTSAKYEYNVSGTYGTSTIKSGFITISTDYDKSVDTNIVTYKLEGKYFVTGASSYTQLNGGSPVYFKKIGNKFVSEVTSSTGEASYVNITSMIQGNPIGDSFKVVAAAATTDNGNPFGYANETNLTFTKIK